MNARHTLLLALSLALAAARGGAATPQVRLSERGCSEFDRARLDELIAIELETVESERTARPSDVALDCRDGVVTIEATLRGTSRQRKSRVDPRAMDRAAATRLLALAITELLAQLWSDVPPERTAPPEPEPRPRPLSERPDSVEPAPAGEDERRVGVFAGAAYRSMLSPRTGLFGGALGAEYEASGFFALALDLEIVHGSVRSANADVDVLSGSAAVYAALGARFGAVALGAGPGFRLGWVSLSPTPLPPGAVGSDVSGAWGGPLLVARAKWANGGYALHAGVEGGIVTLPVVGTLNGEGTEVELRGAFVAVGAGVGINL